MHLCVEIPVAKPVVEVVAMDGRKGRRIAVARKDGEQKLIAFDGPVEVRLDQLGEMIERAALYLDEICQA
jgi:hypothetical protein